MGTELKVVTMLITATVVTTLVWPVVHYTSSSDSTVKVMLACNHTCKPSSVLKYDHGCYCKEVGK